MGLYEKLARVQASLNAPKGQYNSFGKYAYRSCEDIMGALKAPLAEVGAAVVVSDEMTSIDGHRYVKATASFIDIETDKVVSVSAFAREAESKKGMDDAQVTGSTSSYARKYALNGLFLIDDTKDPDTNEQRTEQASRAQKAKKQEQPWYKTFYAAQINEHGKDVVDQAFTEVGETMGKPSTLPETEAKRFMNSVLDLIIRWTDEKRGQA